MYLRLSIGNDLEFGIKPKIRLGIQSNNSEAIDGNMSKPENKEVDKPPYKNFSSIIGPSLADLLIRKTFEVLNVAKVKAYLLGFLVNNGNVFWIFSSLFSY
ncbi:hypothetical protein [Algoriphagus antarcticus]|uniref:Uncharacterized protein n=1 Tax=Algoriphagus antarcticus TaxID=238540 RepID=A0A3E0DKQ7_9BACT|nr:hypothetical protein [Algoriphagus antarcticus]REG82092.1 hypothetical protein C8N25_12381 [Algoriphagus antarcticus]